MEKTGFFEEAPGQRSIMRVAFFLIIVAALVIALYQAFTRPEGVDIPGFATMAGIASGLKLYQKHQENTNEANDSKK